MADRQIRHLDSRRFDALKKGIHRITKEGSIPVAVHVVGLGKAGANVIAQMLHDDVGDLLSDPRVRFGTGL